MAAFGTVFMPKMTLATYENEHWSPARLVNSDAIQLHPGAHVLHYASTCFEGLKAFKHSDDSINIFRMDQNIERMAQSSQLLSLPPIDKQLLKQMIIDVVREHIHQVPAPPGSMYIRPTHIGTEPAIGKAAHPTNSSMLYILLSPVGDYFSGGIKPLKLLIEENGSRCAAHMGMIKSGGNYASALGPILAAHSEYQADQVLFCPDGDVQETGAANFLLIDGNEIITKSLDSSFLHGITRDSILTLARDSGMTVSERELSVDELIERAEKRECEAALSGTAAVLTPVGTLIRDGQQVTVGNGQGGPTTQRLRESLNAIQWGEQADSHNWLTRID
ncbi:branched-chain amino acid aminotransferase [Idiomarina seosinensis]|uniref:Branched-chain-amino-acid aminotransferase n=1 Tax=Idiomarina seosinensis TaxID=281739 RepID=A0A432ZHT7_9GAMM|nr:branched-chain amino acid aminotransferase [Idiomarina seosinensis]RUO77380.1 branched chain amino acid aminotransferase [Idiomarina seosinensis]